MPCDACRSVEDVSDDLPYSLRICAKCGREMRVRELGKHGIGITVNEGEKFVIPANFIKISANPLKSSGRLTRQGLAWFMELVFGTEIAGSKTRVLPYINGETEKLFNFIKSSQMFKGVDFSDPNNANHVVQTAATNRGTAEWFAYVAGTFALTAKEAISEGDAEGAAWAMTVSERFRSLWIFKEHFEDAVWMGQSAKRLVDVLSLWRANQANGDEGFWQIKLQEASYIFSQLFSVPVTFIQGRAYVGGQQIDGRNARLVDFLLSGGTSGEAILIEIKTPVTGLIQKSKYRTSIHAPDAALSGAVVQAADYRNSVLQELREVTRDRAIDLSAFNPKVIVIIGNYASELDTEDKRRSFELYRSSLSNIDIVTFDELFRKIEHLARLFGLIYESE